MKLNLRSYSIGYRTMKTALGVAIAITMAQWLQLDYYVSAGILTILCIQPTKKKSIRAAFSRFIASIIGIAYAFIFFDVIYYFPVMFVILIVFFILLLLYL